MSRGVTLDVLIFALIGGSGSIAGPVIGGLILVPFVELISPLGEIHPLILGTLLLIIMIKYPKDWWHFSAL